MQFYFYAADSNAAYFIHIKNRWSDINGFKQIMMKAMLP